MKRLPLLLTVLLLLPIPAKAQLGAMIAMNTPYYARGVVHFKDGRQGEYLWVELPKISATEVRVTDDPKKKKVEKLSAADIDHIVFWSDKFPEDKVALWYIHADKSKLPLMGLAPVDGWGYPIAASAWGAIFKCNAFYQIDKKSGHIVAGYTYDQKFGAAGENPALCYLVCKDFKNAQTIGHSGSYDGNNMQFYGYPKHIAPFFKSNPEISDAILKKKLTAINMQYILDQMAIYHGLTVPEEEKEEVEVNVNGQEGDDE